MTAKPPVSFMVRIGKAPALGHVWMACPDRSTVRAGLHRSAKSGEMRPSPSEAELVDRCLRKDNSAWEQIICLYRRKVFHIAYKFTGRYEEAEDLTQEIFLRLFRCLDKFDRDADFAVWLSSVARNHCIDHYRSTRREREVLVEELVSFETAPATSGNPQRLLEDHDRRSRLRQGLDQLPAALRQAVILRDLYELSYQEMARRLRLPEGTVKSRINRGRKELARVLLHTRHASGVPDHGSRVHLRR